MAVFFGGGLEVGIHGAELYVELVVIFFFVLYHMVL